MSTTIILKSRLAMSLLILLHRIVCRLSSLAARAAATLADLSADLLADKSAEFCPRHVRRQIGRCGRSFSRTFRRSLSAKPPLIDLELEVLSIIQNSRQQEGPSQMGSRGAEAPPSSSVIKIGGRVSTPTQKKNYFKYIWYWYFGFGIIYLIWGVTCGCIVYET